MKSFSEKRSLKKHIVTVHEKQKPFDFEFCEYKCCVKSSMMMHISSVHNEIKPFKCEMCDKSFPKRTPLERHIRGAKIYGDKRTCPNHILEQSLENVIKMFEYCPHQV